MSKETFSDIAAQIDMHPRSILLKSISDRYRADNGQI